MPFLKARSIGAYEGVLLEAIHMFKYSGKTSLAKPLGKLMADGFSNKGCDLVVPVPLHKTRLKERGFNQSLFLARELAAIHNLPVDYIHLKRIRATDPQINLKEKERVKNVRGAFAAADGKVFIDKHILLIDDVYTTGATIRECGRILKRAGAKGIDVLTLARVVNL
ncbi:MAG: ComF family protein [Deltaproteobacteria bacterium]|nr:ComF family protein [Deltaproteobacteria bacterium]